MKKHDENKDLRSISKIARIDYSNKTINYSPSAIIGIRRWGKIDFLVNYCGWTLIRRKDAGVGGYVGTSEDKTYARDVKKIKKEHKLSDKRNKK